MTQDPLVTFLLIMLALQVLAMVGVVVGGIMAIFPATRRAGGWLALGSGVAIIVFAGMCFGIGALSNAASS